MDTETFLETEAKKSFFRMPHIAFLPKEERETQWETYKPRLKVLLEETDSE